MGGGANRSVLGEPEDWAALELGHHESRLLRRIRRMMGPAAREGVESSDVLQSVYAEALQGLRQGNLVGDQLLPWMTEVARHKIIDEARRKREASLEASNAAVASESPSMASRLSDQEIRTSLREVLAELTPDRRRVLELRCEDGWAWERVARELGRSEEAARKLYHRALLELGQSLTRRNGREVPS